MLSKFSRTSSILSHNNPASLTQIRTFRSDLIGTDIWRWRKKDRLAELRALEYVEQKPETIKVAVTGASGNIGYALLFRLASGEMFGKNQRVQIHAFDIPPMIEKVKGIAMELYDCAFPTCEGILVTDSVERAFDDIDCALFVGSKPRGPGQERGDLIKENGVIFKSQAEALNKYSRKENTQVTVVGNPANTNCLILANNCPDIPVENFSAMTRLDHDRGLAQVALKAKCKVTDISKFAIWGNHSSTQFPDLTYATIKGEPALEYLKKVNSGENIDDWYRNEFIPTVAKRGAAIIDARGASSAASAANACLAAARDWQGGTNGEWTSMAVCSNGEYNITPGLFYSYPVTIENEKYSIVDNLPSFNDLQMEKIKATEQELKEERDVVSSLLPN